MAVAPGRLVLTKDNVLGWTKEIHREAGNLLLHDGSVQQATSNRIADVWRNARKSSGLSTNVWIVP